jgi:predicted transcriptional regulator
MSSSKDELLNMFDEVNPIDDEISRLIQTISCEIIKSRLEMGMARSEFAKYLGCEEWLIHEIECDDYDFEISTFVSILNKLGKKVEILIVKSKRNTGEE